eukprot:5794510-Prymnesium_polylepis.2
MSVRERQHPAALTRSPGTGATPAASTAASTRAHSASASPLKPGVEPLRLGERLNEAPAAAHETALAH